MRLDFDINEFCQNLRATKPPYECPVKDCGKIYKSFAGIQNHVFNCHQDKGTDDSGDDTQNSSTCCTDPQKLVELEVDGKVQKLNVYEPLSFISKDEWEALVPIKSEVVPPETAKTPTPKPIIARYAHKKTPRLTSLPENPTVTSLARGSPEKLPAANTGPPRLPEPQFAVLADWDNLIPDALERPASYYRFIEKSNDELDEEVEYDLDEEDVAWLKVMNQRRKAEGFSAVAPESLELLLDRLEKESYFQMQSAGKEQSIPIDEDAVCCICMDGECQNSNVILFCDMCNLAVHQECYGVPYIPEGQWLCRRCLQSPSRAVECALCPNRGGAFKQTDDGRWAHVVCALWIPEVCFSNTVFLEPIDSIPNIPAARWKLTCYVCKQRGVGACIQCHKANCYTAFHVTCAQAAGLHMKIDTVRDPTSSGVPVSVRKTAFCDAHAPADSDVVRDANDSGRKGQANPGQVRAVFRERMKQARKMLAEKRQAPPVVSVPTIPPDNVKEIGALLHAPGKNKFVQRLIAYWTLKRQARNGVPLLRRLHNTHPQRHQEEKTGEEEAYDQVRFWQRLRQDLERARLLCELIRKRERTKRQLLKCKEEELELKLWPEQYFFRKLLDVLRDKDVEMGEVFAEPVDVKEVPDYLDIVKSPMDLTTMRQKLEQKQYPKLEALYRDFSLMIENCLEYNSRETIFYKTALKMRDVAKAMFKQTKIDMEVAGLQAYTGTTLDAVPQPMPQAQQEDIAKQVDAYLCDPKRAHAPLESQLSHLEDLLAKAQSMPQNQAKSKRVRALRLALGQVKRQLSLEAGGRAAATRASASPQKKPTRAAPPPHRSSSSDSEEKSDSDTSESSSEASKSPLPPPPPPPPAPPTRRGRNTLAQAAAAPRQLTIDAFLAKKEKEKEKLSKLQDKKDAELKGKVINKVMKRSGKDLAPNSGAAAVVATASGAAAENLESLNEARITALPITPVKQNAEGVPNPSTQPSPAGVNRRTAVLFTRKAAAALKKPEAPAPPTKRGSNRTRKPSETTASIATVAALASTVPPAAITTTNTTTTGSGRRKGGAKAQNLSSQQQHSNNPSIGSLSTTQPSAGLFSMSLPTASTNSNAIIQPSTLLSSNNTDLAALPLESESFRIYRPSRPGGGDDDDFKRSRSSSPSHTSDSDSESQESDEEGGEDDEDVEEEEAAGNAVETVTPAGTQNADEGTPAANNNAGGFDPTDLALQPMDLVWAKCRGFPWYPALIINPGMPRNGVLHNGVPIPVPPEDVLALGQQGSNQKLENHFLVLFFDSKRTWQWLPRSKLEPLGVDAGRDKCHLVGSRRPAERRAVKAAYQEALLHRCQVAGQEVQLSGEEDSSSDSASGNSDSDHDED